MIAHVEAQQAQQAAQDHLQASYQEAAGRHSDIEPDVLAEAGEIFDWDFDAAADGIRQVRAEYEAEHAPATIAAAVDQLVARHGG